MSYTLPKSTLQSTKGPSAGTSSGTAVMMGLGTGASAVLITPKVNGKFMVIITGDVSNATAANPANIELRYGTGTAPNNGDAATGTSLGAILQIDRFAAASALLPFIVNGIVSGLIVGTQYWFDLAVASTSGTLVTITNCSETIVGI